MRAYRRLWWTAILAALLPAAALALLLSPVPTLVVAAAVLGLLTGAALVGVDVLSQFGADLLVATALPVAVTPALRFWTIPLLFASLLTSPSVTAVVLRRTGVLDTTAGGSDVLPFEYDEGTGTVLDVGSCLGAMSGPELCLVWSATFAGVKSAPSARERCLQAGIRGSLLDELDRRDHERFVHWLSSRPSAASAPRWVIEAPKRLQPPHQPS